MARSLLIATTNPGKVREVAGCLAGLPGLKVISLADLPPRPEVPETGATFAENAAAKAVGYSRAHEGLTLADDSGLCVDALGGEPGVLSARYGGPGLDDPGRCRYLLERIRDVPEARRSARFECVLADRDVHRRGRRTPALRAAGIERVRLRSRLLLRAGRPELRGDDKRG
jgi:XTP/dITP diphosphohydrolase